MILNLEASVLNFSFYVTLLIQSFASKPKERSQKDEYRNTGKAGIVTLEREYRNDEKAEY